MTKADIQNIKKLISENKLEKAIQQLLGLLEGEDELNEVILLSGRLNDLSRKERLGLLPFEQIATQKNTITYSLLAFVNTLKPEDDIQDDNTTGGNISEKRETARQRPPDEKRLALVIGCSEYEYAGKLDNPINDANGMKERLAQKGFDVILKTNPTLRDMKMTIDDFGIELKDYHVGLFYFAGHGVQVNGTNYLIPVDANLQHERAVEYDCVNANRVLSNMEEANNRVNIMILDACRNNPFERSWGRGINGRGLAVMNAPMGSVISYATAPGTTASDGTGDNGLYTGALIEELKTAQSHSIIEMFQEVRSKVSQTSNGEQVPWESTSLTGNFYL